MSAKQELQVLFHKQAICGCYSEKCRIARSVWSSHRLECDLHNSMLQNKFLNISLESHHIDKSNISGYFRSQGFNTCGFIL